MNKSDYLLAILDTLWAASALVSTGIFIFTYGRTKTKLSLYLALNFGAVLMDALVLSIIRWENAVVWVSQPLLTVRILTVIICLTLTAYSGIRMAMMLGKR